MRIRVDHLDVADRLADRFRAILRPDARPLMITWMEIIRRDNERGVLEGLDKDGRPLAPVTYRPIPAAMRLTAAQKNLVKGNRRGLFAGLGASPGGMPNNNLTSAEYRRLGGPPLAPRGKYSRVVTNLETEFAPPSGAGAGGTGWQAYGYWREVVSVQGAKFLQYHFHGVGKTKKRDLTGVRPQGVQRASRSAVAWIIDIVRSGGSRAPAV